MKKFELNDINNIEENEDIENLLTNVINTGKNSIVRYSKLIVDEENEEF